MPLRSGLDEADPSPRAMIEVVDPDDPDRVNPFIQATLDKDATEGNPQTGDSTSLADLQKKIRELEKAVEKLSGED